MSKSLLDAIFNGALDGAIAIPAGSEREIELKFKPDANHSVMVQLVKTLLIKLWEQRSKTTKFTSSNTVVWTDNDYQALRKQFDGTKPMPGNVRYQKIRIGATDENTNGVSCDLIRASDSSDVHGGADRYGAAKNVTGIRLDVQDEIPITSANKPLITRGRARSRVTISDHPLLGNWHMDISRTITHSGGTYKDVAGRVISDLDWLFTNGPMIDLNGDIRSGFMNGSAWRGGIEIEMEYHSTGPVSAKKALEPIWGVVDLIDSCMPDDTSKYQAAVFEMAKALQVRNVGAYRRRKGIKQLGVAAAEMGRLVYDNEFHRVLAEGNQYIAYKADGERVFVHGKSDGSIVVIGGTHVVLTDRRIPYNIEKSGGGDAAAVDPDAADTDSNMVIDEIDEKAPPEPKYSQFVLEGEIMPDGRLLVYDALMYEVPIHAALLPDRLEMARKALEEIIKVDPVAKSDQGTNTTLPQAVITKGSKVKQFTRCTSDNYAADIKKFLAGLSKVDYATDGFIFTPSDPYFASKIYKWKPHTTIDFYVSVDKGNVYLMCGISDVTYQSIRHPKNFPMRNKFVSGRYFPMPFSPAVNPQAYEYQLTDADRAMLRKHFGTLRDLEGNLNGSIVEFTFLPDLDDNGMPVFAMERVRDDRRVDVATGAYFGNNYHVAMDNYMINLYPLELDHIISSASDAVEITRGQGVDDANSSPYFQVHDNTRYKALRNFNNLGVKNYVFSNTFDGVRMLMEIAAGMGQDLRRAADNGIHHVFAVEVDTGAIAEMVRRYLGMVRTPTGRGGLTLQILHADVLAESTPSALINRGIGGNCEGIHCSFALHYFSGSQAHIAHVAEMVGNAFAPGGKFVFTCFDAKRVLALLRENGGSWSVSDDDGVKYQIDYVGGDPTSRKVVKPPAHVKPGQSIRALLPFSNGELYQEFLVPITTWKTELKRNRVHHIETIEFAEFAERTPEAAKFYAAMSDNDRKFASLYSCYVFEASRSKPRKK